MKKNTTFVSFLLDETGSMQSIKSDTVGGFNAYVETLQKGGADIVFSLVSFNSNKTTPRYVADPIDTIKPLTEDTYQPAAMTPLIDASVKIINATDDAVKKRGDDPNVLIVFQTDGEENVSVEYTNADLATLIKEKTAARDAGITIDAGHHVSYQRHLSREAFAETAANTQDFAVSGLSKSLDYSRAQRARVGDTHTEKWIVDLCLDVHKYGKDADMRPVAKNGYEGALTRWSSNYSNYRTRHWITAHLKVYLGVKLIFFNDPNIYNNYSYVQYWNNHDNHLHLRIY